MTPADARERRRWTLVLAAFVVAVTVVVVALFGLVPYPDIPSLADQPSPAVGANLAVLRYDRDGPCLTVIDGGADTRELGCGSQFEGFGLAWLGEDRLALRTSESRRPVPVGGEDSPTTVSPPVTVFDAASGEVLDQTNEEALGSDLAPLGDRGNTDGPGVATIGGEGDVVWVEVAEDGGPSREVMELTGPTTYSLFDPRWSADGEWIVVQDSINRVIVVDAAGLIGPRVWFEDLTGEYAIR